MAGGDSAPPLNFCTTSECGNKNFTTRCGATVTVDCGPDDTPPEDFCTAADCDSTKTFTSRCGTQTPVPCPACPTCNGACESTGGVVGVCKAGALDSDEIEITGTLKTPCSTAVTGCKCVAKNNNPLCKYRTRLAHHLTITS